MFRRGTSIAVSALQQQSSNVSRLAEIAGGVADKSPEDIYVAVGTLFDREGGQLTREERALAADILRRLSKSVEMSLRIALAERIAGDPTTPHELLLLLVDDNVEVARPILGRSPLLSDADLIHVIQVGSVDHQICVAERPSIGEKVTAALVETNSDRVAVALVRNQTARIGGETYQRLVEWSRNVDDLQKGLIQRVDLPPVLANRLYPLVSDALKAALTARYPDASRTLASAMDETTAALQRGVSSVSESNAARLVAKLLASGELKPSFLMRTLHQGQIDSFEHGFAALLGIDIEHFRRILYFEKPTVAALACRGVGIDRSAFLTVFGLSRHKRQRPFTLNEADRAETDRVFATVGKAEAVARIQDLASKSA